MEESGEQGKFTMVRSKTIEYLMQPAIAIFMQPWT